MGEQQRGRTTKRRGASPVAGQQRRTLAQALDATSPHTAPGHSYPGASGERPRARDHTRIQSPRGAHSDLPSAAMSIDDAPIIGPDTWAPGSSAMQPAPASAPLRGGETTTQLAVPDERAPIAMTETSARQLVSVTPHQTQALLIRGTSNPPRWIGPVVPARGPRSFAMQFVLAMLVAMALFSALVVASPLGQGAGISGSFQAYANAVPWVPTPTPTPSPTPVPRVYTAQPPASSSNPGAQTITAEISAIFGSYAGGALAVARCESGYDPNAWNPYPILGSHASGVFQILYPSTWDGTAYAGYSPFNADANIRAAFQLFQRDGYAWSEWACQP